MNIVKISLLLIVWIGLPGLAKAQSNPQLDRPVQQCIRNQAQDLDVLKPNFSMGFWLGKLIENCEKLQKSSGKGGGPQVVAILGKEAALDELIQLADQCDKLGKVKTLLTEMKAIYQEKQKVETYQKGNSSGNLFDDEDEVTTYSLPREAAKKIKARAEKILKTLKKS